MKKKFLSLVLMICLLIPCMFSLVGCGGTGGKPVSDEAWENAFGNLKNYSIIGGPSTEDADYGEYYFEENGFRMYTPNNPYANRQEAYIKYDAQSEQYYKWTKLTASGNWQFDIIDQDTYVSSTNSVIEQYLQWIDSQELFVETKTGFKNKTEITGTVTGLTYTFHYYDIQINIDEDGKITSATWKQKFSQGNAESYVYNMTLSVGDVELTYPTSNYITTEATWKKVMTFSLYTPFSMTVTRDGVVSSKYYHDGRTYYRVNFFADNDTTDFTIACVGDKYYRISRNNTYHADTDSYTTEETARVELSEEDYKSYMEVDFSNGYKFSDFTYDADNDKYTASSSNGYSNVTVIIRNNLCQEFGGTYDYVNIHYTISYNDSSISSVLSSILAEINNNN